MTERSEGTNLEAGRPEGVRSTERLGAAVIVDGAVVAWFADFTEEAREWCTENHFGRWLVWRAKAPEIVPLTEAEYDQVMKEAKEMAKLFEDTPEAPNVRRKAQTAVCEARRGLSP